MSYIVAIVGRPNVGKSTLFNRLTESRAAIVNETSGVTRDRHYGTCIWGDKSFSVIDTGGFTSGSDDIFEGEINKQVENAIEESDLVLFMVDVSTGITDYDERIAKMLRKKGKNTLVVVNKVDNSNRVLEANNFYSLGLKELFAVSATNGSGTGDLLDEVTSKITKAKENEEEIELPKFTIVGKPNVGKSSLTNVLLGHERAIVTPRAGTTRDSIDMRYNAYGFDFILVDTAGLRKKSKVVEDLEFYSVMRTIRSIEQADICILMVDAVDGMQSQDINILSLVQKNNKGLVVVVNKWDLVEKDHTTSEKYEALIYKKAAPFTDFPIIFTSVINKQRIHKVLEETVKVYENRKKRIKTSKLNEVLLPLLKNTPPPIYKGKTVSIKYITQLPNPYPAFAIFCNLPQYVKDPYKRFVENRMRSLFDFKGVPIKIYFRK